MCRRLPAHRGPLRHGRSHGWPNESHWVDDLIINLYGSPGPARIVSQPLRSPCSKAAGQFRSVCRWHDADCYQWLANNVEIPGETGPVLRRDAVTLDMNGMQITVRVSNSEGSATSAVATLTVIEDTEPPCWWRPTAQPPLIVLCWTTTKRWISGRPPIRLVRADRQSGQRAERDHRYSGC